MTFKPGIPISPPGPTELTDPTSHLGLAPDPAEERVFAMAFTSTRRGARLARRLAAVRLDAWGISYGTDAHDNLVLIVAELVANAVRHGHVAGRDFHLCLHVAPRLRTARVEVTDTRAESVPPRPSAVTAPRDPYVSPSGRGLLMVTALATRWDWHYRRNGPGKTVWAECDV
ncbi:ATP-binding protein [Streptomyces sp. NPDC091279]|uniref:ATP-binding protein n=1 Tax=unclassified Streptomyces TaxID=2593676 RepID=UPI0038066650